MTFAERENRKRYAVLNPDVLAGIADDMLVQAIIDHIQDVRLTGLERGCAEEYARVEALPANLRPFITTQMLDAEVKNGGFVQWFWNSSGQFAPLVPEDLRRIGADTHAAIVARAVAIHADEKAAFDSAQNSWTPSKAFSQLAKTSKLAALDDEYYAIQVELHTLIAVYARRIAPTIHSP
ncbi:MAG: DUF4375 domain-containing protein [Phycisphaerae bacterium]